MRERDPKAKALVFSQFVSTLDWLKVRLEEQSFGYRTLTGSMTLKHGSQVKHIAFDCNITQMLDLIPCQSDVSAIV